MQATETLDRPLQLLCDKGLALSGVLAPLATTGDSEAWNSHGLQQLRSDEATIRKVFNARYHAIDVFDPVAREGEHAKRTELLCVVYRLYGTARNLTPPELRRELQEFEVEALISTLQRLSVMGFRSWEPLVERCERSAAEDHDLLGVVMDPLLVRYLLVQYSSGLEDAIDGQSLAALDHACRLCDRSAIRIWFQRLLTRGGTLPADAAQRLRALLFDLWRAGVGDLGMLAHEIAVLDVMLFDELGWETTRLFCALLRRMTGPRSEALDAFLSDEDIDGALSAAEELRQDELTAHFRRLAASYDTKLHRDVRRSVFVTADQMRRRSA